MDEVKETPKLPPLHKDMFDDNNLAPDPSAFSPQKPKIDHAAAEIKVHRPPPLDVQGELPDTETSSPTKAASSTTKSTHETSDAKTSPSDMPFRGYARFFRDLDDSSDEEELEEKSVATDYQAQFTSDPKMGNTDNDRRLFYIVHVLSNRLLYSHEVNRKYYSRKQTIGKGSKDFSRDQIVKDLEKFIKDVIRKSLQQIIFKCLRTSDKQLIAPAVVEFFLTQVLSRPETLAFVQEILSQLPQTQKNTRAQLKEKLNALLIAKLPPFLKAVITKEKQEKGYVYRDKAHPIFNTDALSRFIPIEPIEQLARNSIRDRLVGGTLTPNKTNYALRNKPLISPFRRLAAESWGKIQVAQGGSGAEKKLKTYEELLKLQYLRDLFIPEGGLSPVERQQIRTQTCKEIQENPWFFDYLHLDDEQFSVVVDFQVWQTASELIETTFYSRRPTLGVVYCFESQSMVDFLVNLRLAHRTIRRDLKNTQENPLAKKIYSSKTPKEFHFHWQFFGKHTALDNQSINASTLTRTAMVSNISSYNEVYKKTMAIRNQLKEQQVECNEWTFAGWIRECLQGTFEVRSLPLIPEDLQEVVGDSMNTITYLLFGCEVVRNPASLIIHQMMIDLLQNGKTTCHALFAGGMPKMPMATEGGIEIGRAVNVYFTDVKGMVFPYVYDNSKGKVLNGTGEFNHLLTTEPQIVKDWLALKEFDVTKDLNQLAKFICQQFDDWFGKGCFDIARFVDMDEKTLPNAETLVKISQ